MPTIKNLAFKGGGVLGIAYAGAIKVLEDHNMLQAVEKVAGTSAGAITATLLSLRYSSADLKTIVDATSFKSFEDRKNILRIATKYGLYAGDAFLSWMQDQIVHQGLPANATFRDFKNHGCRDLYVFSTDLNTQNLKEFSFEKTPDVIVAEAARASMSIPLFFKAWKFSDNNPDDHIYVDGGMVYNFPLDRFDTGGEPNPETMGFFLSNLTGVPKTNDLSYDEVLHYVKILFETMLDAQSIDFQEDTELKKRTAVIDDLGISATNFDLTPDQEEALYQSGIACTTAFLSQNV